ncbi:nmrA-like family protein [Paraburkholderia xenovorans LB400]|uniref:NAD(P)-binding domain-containing protein n=3 Tax=Pseudomonadota TaxID=1224 RepID=A0A024HJE1_PSEKB|nr:MULTISPECIES: NAD(P)H-binding protein [Pseudomonadota]MBO9332223.1 NAD(P)H-binding protein [Achromobacter xylosoxidans]AIP31832.1 nmrA-like family protein [Paraburkholderia xenovorans LB400]MDD2012803.1 NAD(P)H-binding protein [Pseudomonas putida]CAB3939970.1 hypothetical protein LMG6000_06348 [Achromobacter insolitus]CAB3948960.1 hypothetical protein LMG5997_06546 [Achromobacter insolitus]
MFDFSYIRILTASGAVPSRRMAEVLLGAGTTSIVAQGLHAKQVTQLASRHSTNLKVDFHDAALLRDALHGVDRLLIVPASRADAAVYHLAQVQAIVQAAIQERVQHLIYPSVAAVSLPWAYRHLASERLIAQSGIGFTILRIGTLADCIFHRLPIALRSGVWPTSAGKGRTSYVLRDDAFSASAAALNAHTLPGADLVISGTQDFSMGELVREINLIFGAHIEPAHVDDDVVLATLTGAGVPASIAAGLVATDRIMRRGDAHAVGEGVRQLTGNPAVAVREFLLERRIDVLLASKYGWSRDVAFTRPPSSVQFL